MSEKRSVYVVVGETGDFDDHREWWVAVYEDREAAEEHARLANEKMLDSPHHNRKLYSDEMTEFKRTFPYDNDIRVDLEGTTYSVAEIPFVRHVDEYIETYTRS